METQTVFPAQPTAAVVNKNDIAIKWGVIIGLVSCLITTANFMVVIKSSYIAFLVVTFLAFGVTLVLAGVAAAQQRRAQGGYITFREAFRVVFICILIASLIGTVYGILYTKFIDPVSIARVKEATLGFMERMGVPPDSIDKTASDFDEQQEGSMSVRRIALAFAQSLIVYSLFGLLVALIVRRKRLEGAVGLTP